MKKRIVQLLLSRYMNSPARSWLITSVVAALNWMIRRTVSRREVIDISSIKPGEIIIIEHLPVTHKQQMKEEKRSRRQRRRSSKSTSQGKS